MGYDTRLLMGPRVEPDVLAGWLPRGLVAKEVVLAYDDFVAQQYAGTIGVGAGERTMLVFDPGRRLAESFAAAWGGVGRVVVLDLFEATDAYAVVIHEGERRREIAWHQHRRIRSTGRRLPEEKGHRFPTRVDPQALWRFAERLGFDENPLDWRFTVYAPRRARLARAPALRFAFGPPFVRLLAIADTPAGDVLDAIARHVGLKYKEPLELDHILGHALRTAEVAVASCPGFTAVFDASGSLAFDLRWLAPLAPRRVVATWGHVARRAFAGLDEPAVFGFGLHDGGELKRRVTFSGGRVVDSAVGLPSQLVGPSGTPLGDEAALAEPMTLSGLEALLARFGFDGAALAGARYETYQMIPR